MGEFFLQFLPVAVEDLNNIADYYLQMVGATAAERITNQILDTIERLVTYPYLGSLHPDPVLASMEYRRIVTGNYVCVYKVFDDTVVIYRIVSGTTDYPKYFYPS